jgi:hypothetical protein
MSITTLNGNGHAAYTPAWSTLSVKDFFSQIPWTGASASPMTTTANLDSGTAVETNSLNFQLSVSEFFNRFPWDGKPNIAAPLAPMAVQPDAPEENSLTLDGFADLF